MTIDRDDALLDALGRGDFRADDDLTELLSVWREDLSNVPPAVIIPPPRKRMPHPLLVALAATILTFGGLTAAAATAEPGNPLWTITKIVYADRADSIVARQTAERLLAEADAAVREKRFTDAAALLDAAKSQIAKVNDSTDQTRLTSELTRLEGMLPPPTGTSQQPTTSVTPLPKPSTNASPGAQPSQPTPKPTGGLLPTALPTLLPSLPPLK